MQAGLLSLFKTVCMVRPKSGQINEKVCVYKLFHTVRLNTVYHFNIKEIQDCYCNFQMCVLHF